MRGGTQRRRSGELALAFASIAVGAGCRVAPGGGVRLDQANDTLPLVSLRESGGLTGGATVLVIRRDGQARLVEAHLQGAGREHRWQIGASQLGSLAALVGSPDFARLDSTYLPANACCDRLAYELTARTAEREMRTRTLDGAEAPGVLRSTLELLREIRSRAPGR
jgi:hypothetical protein